MTEQTLTITITTNECGLHHVSFSDDSYVMCFSYIANAAESINRVLRKRLREQVDSVLQPHCRTCNSGMPVGCNTFLCSKERVLPMPAKKPGDSCEEYELSESAL